MVDGTYTIQVDTPFGSKQGTVTLRSEGDVVYGEIDAPVIGAVSTEGKLEGDVFTSEGEFKAPLVGVVTYSLRGEVKDDDLHVVIDSSKGTINMDGVRA